MRSIIVIFGIFLTGCSLIGQSPNEEAKKEVEFRELMNKVKVSQEINKTKIEAADRKTSEKITSAAKQIVSLKNEVKQLKSELNEANKKLDSTVSDNVDIKFNFLPISSSKENW